MVTTPATADPTLDPAGLGAPPVSTGTTTAPIGVGSDYVQPHQMAPYGTTDSQTATGPVGAYGLSAVQPNPNNKYLQTVKDQGTFYMPGAEQAPLHDPSTILPLQDELIQAGLLNASNMRRGVWDQTSADALKTAMALANAWGDNVESVLQYLAANPQLGQTQGSQSTNPLDVQSAFDTAASSLLGGGAPAGEQDAFVNWYKNQELVARQQLAQANLTGGTAPAAPSLDAAAQSYIKAHNLDQMIAYGTAARMLQWEQMLGISNG